MRSAFRISLFLLLSGVAVADAQINPATQIRWPANCVGGNLFYDIVHNVCTAGTSTVTIGVNGQPVTTPNFSDTTPAAPTGGANIHFQVSGNNISAYGPPGGGGGGSAPATCYADQQAGSTWDAKVQACLNTVYSIGGGTVDARGLSGSQSLANNLIVGDGTHSVTLVMGAMTLARATGKQIFYNSHSSIVGQGQGTVITGDAQEPAIQQVYGSPNDIYLSRFQISSSGTVTKNIPALEVGGPNPNIPYGDAPAGATHGEIGSDYVYGSFFPGQIAQFAVYQKALTPAQIANHWTVGSGGSNYEGTVLGDTPLAYYPLKETSGTNAADLANSRNGLYTGGYTLASSNGIPGDTSCSGVCKAPLFDGSSGFVALPTYTWIAAQSNWTIEMWANTNTPASLAKRLWGFSLNSGNVTVAADWAVNGGLQILSTYSGFAQQTQFALQPSSWYHLVFVHTNAGLLFYVNGALLGMGSDVTNAVVEDVIASGADIGVLMDSQHGCICYNIFRNVSGTGATAGVKTDNHSGYAFGVNQNQWYGGKGGGPIGLWDSGSATFSWYNMDFENNQSSNGSILYAHRNGYSAGSGYSVGDTVRPAGGGGNAVLTVTAVSGGAVTNLSVTNPGTGYGNNLNQGTTALTGAGSGLVVDTIVSAHQLLLAIGANSVETPYEEAGGTDYICGTGYYISGSYASASGATYQPNYCTEPTGQYSGPGTNFMWGSGASPYSIGIRSGGAGIVFGGTTMNDDGYNSASVMGIEGSGYSPLVVGLHYAGGAQSVYGFRGHAPFEVGRLLNTGGQSSTGVLQLSKIADPAAPTVTPNPSGGSTTYQYAVVCNGFQSGVSLQSATGTTATGPATLDSSHYNSIAWNCPDGYTSATVLKNVSGSWQAFSGGQQQASSLSDTGQTLVAYTAPARNNTADIYAPTGYVTAAGFITQGLTQGPATVCANGPGGAFTNVNCPANTQYVSNAPSSPTAAGSAGQWASLNGTVFAYDATAYRWIQLNGTANWSWQAYDDFAGPNNTPLSSHSDLQGHNWVLFFQSVWNGSLVLSGTTPAYLIPNNGVGTLNLYYDNFTPTSPDYSVNFPCYIDPGTTGNGWCMAISRLNAPSSSNFQGYGCIYQQGMGVSLTKWTGGSTSTPLGTAYNGVTSGWHTIGITTSGTTITCTIDSRLLTGTASATDSTYTAAGYPGLAVYQPAYSYNIYAPFTVK